MATLGTLACLLGHTMAQQGDVTCVQDSDCAPEVCCHASACVAAAQAPDCRSVMCTQQCVPHTMDCGGRCACEQGLCRAKLRSLHRHRQHPQP